MENKICSTFEDVEETVEYQEPSEPGKVSAGGWLTVDIETRRKLQDDLSIN